MNCARDESGQLLCSTCVYRNTDSEDRCAAHWFFNQFGDKWTLPVLGLLHAGPLRFSQFRKTLEPMSERMLILALKKLEKNGLICRDESGHSPLHNTYRLTPDGRALLDQMADLYAWMDEHGPAILAAIVEFNAKPAATVKPRRRSRKLKR